MFDLKHQNCLENRDTVFRATKGIVTGETWQWSGAVTPFQQKYSSTAGNCPFSVRVPVGLHISVAVRLGDMFCKHGQCK